jgi:hypothetical protein
MKRNFHQLVAVATVCVFALTTVLADQGQNKDKQKAKSEDKSKDKQKDKEKEQDRDKEHDEKGTNGCWKPKRCGTGILHLDISEKMVNEGGPSNATALVQTSYHSQGNATVQRFELKVCKLDTNALYQLWAEMGGETNFDYVADIATGTKNGSARLNYKSTTATNGCFPGKGYLPLPDGLNPVYNIHSVAIGDVNTQAVFTAQLTSPDKLQYLIKRCITNDTVIARMDLHANTKWVKFKFCVAGLVTSTNYFLTVNNDAVSSGTSSTNGTLCFCTLPVGPTNILTVTNIGLWDSSSNTVISTTLPEDTFTDNSSTNVPTTMLVR